jgi:hypothetical protein
MSLGYRSVGIWRFFSPILYMDIVSGTQTVFIRNVRQVSGKCAESRHARSRFNMSVTPSVCLSVCLSVYLSARVISAPTKRLSMNFDLGTFIENCRENLNFVKIRKKIIGNFCIKT